MKRILFTVSFSCFFVVNSNQAQKKLGIGITFGRAKGPEVESKYDPLTGNTISKRWELNYLGTILSYKKNIYEFESSSLGINLPITIGFLPFSEAAKSKLYYDGHLLLQYQRGALSSKENYDLKGYYFGAGFGMYHGTWIPADVGFGNPNHVLNSIGPIFEAGYRTRYGRAEYYTDLRLFFKPISNPGKNHHFVGGTILLYIK
jgi:hypothetical protein